MDYTDLHVLRTMTDDEIQKAIQELTEERLYRKQQREAKLIEDFRQAFLALNSAGFTITYSDGDNDIEDLTLFWDGFSFD